MNKIKELKRISQFKSLAFEKTRTLGGSLEKRIPALGMLKLLYLKSSLFCGTCNLLKKILNHKLCFGK